MPILELVHPIRAHGESVTMLEFREPRARDLREFKIGDNSVGNFIPLIAALAAVPPSSIDEMHPADLFAAIEVIAPLLVESQEIGTKS